MIPPSMPKKVNFISFTFANFKSERREEKFIVIRRIHGRNNAPNNSK